MLLLLLKPRVLRPPQRRPPAASDARRKLQHMDSSSATGGAPAATTYLFAALRSVGTVAVLVTAGAVLRCRGIMTPEFIKGLSHLALKLTLPLLLFTSALNCLQDRSQQPCGNLASNIEQGWPLFVLPLWYVGTGLVVGAVAARIGGAVPENFRAAIAAVAFGNSTGLPVTLLQTIQLQFSPSSDLGSTNPLIFLAVYLILYPMLQWSVGLFLLRKIPPQVSLADAPSGDNDLKRLTDSDSSPEGLQVAHVTQVSLADAPSGGSDLKSLRASDSSPQGPRAASDRSARLTQSERSARSAAAEAAAPAASRSEIWMRRACRVPLLLWQHRWSILPPPALGALCGALVAIIPGFQGLFVDVNDRDDDAPLEWLFDGMLKLAAAAVPVNMLLLGSTLAKGVAQRDNLRAAVSFRLALCVAVAKLVVMPSIGLATGLAIHGWGLVAASTSRTFFLVSMIVTCTPTANSIVLMAELAGCNREAVSASILLQYILSPLTLTFWLWLYISVVLAM